MYIVRAHGITDIHIVCSVHAKNGPELPLDMKQWLVENNILGTSTPLPSFAFGPMHNIHISGTDALAFKLKFN